MKLGTFTLSALVCAVLMLGIGYMVPESRPIVPTPTAPVDKRIQQALAEPSALTVRDLPLCDVVARLSHRHQIPISLDYDALAAAGLTGKEPVNLDVSGPALGDLLNLVLRQDHLCYAVRDRAVVITTIEARETGEPKLVGKVYPLTPPLLGSGSLAEETMSDLIRYTIAPYSWAEVGGPGELQAIPGALVVIQPPDVHEQVSSVLSHAEWSIEHADSTSPIYLSPEDRKHRRIIEALNRIVDVRFRDVPFDEVCRNLSTEYDVPIVVDRESFNYPGLEVDTTVSVNLRDVPLRTALREVLNELQVNYSLFDGVINIHDVYGHAYLTRAYSVGDLTGLRGRNSGYGLIETLTNVVHPQSWDFVRGPSSVELVDSRHILISAERDTLREVESFLGELRDALDPTPSFAVGSERSPMTRRIEMALRQPASLRFEGALLDQVADWIRETYEINVRLDYVTLDNFRVSADTRITCNVRGKSLEEALRETLRPLGLDILIRDDMLCFDSAWGRDDHRVRRFYEVGQLIDADFGFLDEHTLEVLIQSAVELMEGRSNEPRCAVIHDEILIVFENRDVQKEIAQILTHLADNAERLRREIDAFCPSRREKVNRLLAEIRSHVTPLREIEDDTEPNADTPDLGMGLGGR